jgi:hypothetical protein
MRFLGKYDPVISYRFPPAPEKRDKISNAALQFCFPEAITNDIKPILRFSKRTASFVHFFTLLKNFSISSFCLCRATGSETFSFVLTDADGSKRFGYCRRFLGKNPECYCIVSFL